MGIKSRREARRRLPKALRLGVPTEFMSPESSSIWGATYDVGQETVRITFRHPKVTPDAEEAWQTYVYGSFPPALWQDFYHAKSKGKFFAEAIRPMFNGKLL